jgi:DNA-binding PadR family transcriptional regulator
MVILGLLTGDPQSGYDLKKRIAASEGLHWSGNNNQVYRSLVELHQTGLTSVTVEQPSKGPARKLYAITKAGREALREWLLGEPELPQMRSPILARLSGADLLADVELVQVLAAYDVAVGLKLMGLRETERRGVVSRSGDRSRASVLRDAIERRTIALFEDEQRWVRELMHSLQRDRKAGRP